MAGRGRVYVNPNGGTIGENEVTGLNISYMGETKDGFQIHHYTFFRNGKRMSYDTVRMNDEYHYILGSGHEVDENGNVSQWDPGTQLRGNDAVTKYAHQICKNVNP